MSVAQAAVADVAEPSERPRLLGLLGAAFGVGFVAGPALGASPRSVARTSLLRRRRRRSRQRPRRHQRRPPGDDSCAPRSRFDVDLPAPNSAGRAGSVTRCPAADAVAHRLLCRVRRHAAFAGFEATFALFGQADSTWLVSTAAVFTGIGLFLVLVQAGLVHPRDPRLGEVGTLRGGLMVNVSVCSCSRLARPLAGARARSRSLVIGQGLIDADPRVGRRGPLAESNAGQWLGLQQMAGGVAASSVRRWPAPCSSTSESARRTSPGPVPWRSRSPWFRRCRTALGGGVHGRVLGESYRRVTLEHGACHG